jgi:predicted lysophospholipase L1 biosynthesis ABC-type transport system permease subunit
VTLGELGKKVGDTVLVGSPPHRRPFVIVGTVTLPSFGVAGTEHVSLGRGGMLSAADLAAAESTGTKAAAQPGSAAGTVAIDLAAGLSPGQRSAFLGRITAANPDGTAGGTYELHQVRGAAVADASAMSGQPLALAVGLTAAALLSLALAVLASVRRRRRELALLKTLGMTRHQLRSVVAWQTTITLALTALGGLVAGIAAGRWAWQAFAHSLGVVPATVIPVPTLAAGVAGLFLAGTLLSLLPATVAARVPAAVTLRAD